MGGVMDPALIYPQLEAIADAKYFDEASQPVIDALEENGAGFEAVDPIVRFMEDHPEIDFGSPGGLTHFVERFYGQQYKELIMNSVSRRPTRHTLWLLNRMVNADPASPDWAPFQGLLAEWRK